MFKKKFDPIDFLAQPFKVITCLIAHESKFGA